RDKDNIEMKSISTDRVPTADTAGEWEKITLEGEIPEEVDGTKVSRVQTVITVREQEDIPVYVDDNLFYQEDESNNLLDNPSFEDIEYNDPAEILVDYVKKSTGAELLIKTPEELEEEPVEGNKIYIGNKGTIEDPHIDEALQDLDEE